MFFVIQRRPCRAVHRQHGDLRRRRVQLGVHVFPSQRRARFIGHRRRGRDKFTLPKFAQLLPHRGPPRAIVHLDPFLQRDQFIAQKTGGVFLNGLESSHMDEHRVVFPVLPPRPPGRAGQDKAAERLLQRRRQLDRHMRNLVRLRERRRGHVIRSKGGTMQITDDGQRITRLDPGIRIAIQPEHPGRSDVVRRRLDVDNETSWENILAVFLRLRLGVDEDVRKRRRCVADIRRLIEGVQNIPNSAVDGRNIDLVWVSLAFVFDVDRRVVGLVVQKKQRNIPN